MGTLKKILNNFEGYCCVVSLAAMSIIIFVQVICRYVLQASLPWSEETSRYLLVWTTFLGGAYGVRQGAHIGIEAFTLLLPKKARKILAVIVMLASILLCAIIFKFGVDLAVSIFSKKQMSPALRVPMGYIYSAIPIGMVFFIIRYIQEIYEVIKGMRHSEAKEVVK